MATDYAGWTGVTLDQARQELMQQLNKTDPELVLPASMRPAIALAVASHDQVRAVAGFGGVAFIGFDQQAVHATAQMHGITLTPKSAADLQILQAEGLRIMRKAS